jgi:hypothetical protein
VKIPLSIALTALLAYVESAGTRARKPAVTPPKPPPENDPQPTAAAKTLNAAPDEWTAKGDPQFKAWNLQLRELARAVDADNWPEVTRQWKLLTGETAEQSQAMIDDWQGVDEHSPRQNLAAVLPRIIAELAKRGIDVRRSTATPPPTRTRKLERLTR